MAIDRNLIAGALPGYEVGDEIARGGWGAVYRGRHIALGREVAIKQLPSTFADDASALDRFVSEARTIGRLDHPHVVKVYDFVSHEGTWLIVMEYLGGGTLWDEFQRSGIRADKACAVVLAVAAGLEVAHEHGILHRDIKPENIMFASDGTTRICDFGIAKSASRETRHTQVGEVVGTPTYMSPEQAMGDELTAGSDVYSLGIVTYELLAGRLPFPEARSPTQQLIQHVSEQPIPLSESATGLPGAIADVVMTALEKRPADRFASAQAFGVALARAAGESFGGGWLDAAGVVLMGGGRIQSAALRTPTMGAPTQQPTQTLPAVRDDHFRPAVSAGAGSVATPAAPSEPPPPGTGAPATVATPQPSVPHVATDSGLSPLPEPAEPVTPPPGSPVAAPPDGSGGGSRPRGLVVVALVLAAVLAAAGAIFVLGSGDDDPTGDTETVDPGTAQSPDATAPTTTTATTTAAEVDVPPPTSAPVRECPSGERCSFIDSISVGDDQLTIEWTAVGFEPVIAEGQFHVHFFWDIYSPDQAGTNAAVFGVAVGEWELTADQPFVSAGEMRPSKRPAAANRICTSVVNGAHAIVNPLLFDCVPIPEGV